MSEISKKKKNKRTRKKISGGEEHDRNIVTTLLETAGV